MNIKWKIRINVDEWNERRFVRYFLSNINIAVKYM